tara:strand:+ start:127 stop:336 length:210 start_codon:yes stop_codon:yes gene_type:complete
MPRALMKVKVMYVYDFGNLSNETEVPILFVKGFIEDGGNPINLENAMPHQVYLAGKKVLKAEIIEEDGI